MTTETRRFHDRHHAYEYLVGKTIGDLLLADPALMIEAKRRMAEFYGDIPAYRDAKTLWGRLLERPAAEVAEKLSRNDAEGDFVRQTRPPFVALAPKVRVDLIAEAHRIFDRQTTR